MKNKTKLFSALLALVLLLSLAACGNKGEAPATASPPAAGEDPAPEVTEAPAAPEPLALSDSSLFLSSGETAELSVNRTDAEYAVANEAVATVDNSGRLTALAHGVTYVTVSSQGETATCGVFVDVLGGDGYVDINGKSMTPVVYMKELIKPTIMQSWDYLSETGDFFFTQQYDATPSDDIITRLQPDGTETYMRLLNAGHGNVTCAEYDEDGQIWLWVNANGDVSNSHNSFMRVKWVDGGVVDNDCEYIWKIDGMTFYPYAVADGETGLVLLFNRPGSQMNFQIYDEKSLLAGDPVLLTSFQVSRSSQEGEPGSQDFQGSCIYGDHIYILEGAAHSNVYLYVFDFTGELVSSGLVSGYEDIIDREPEGLQVIDGEVYVGIGGGEKGARRASVFVLR